MDLRIIGSSSWLVTVADRPLQTTTQPLISAAGLTRDECVADLAQGVRLASDRTTVTQARQIYERAKPDPIGPGQREAFHGAAVVKSCGLFC